MEVQSKSLRRRNLYPKKETEPGRRGRGGSWNFLNTPAHVLGNYATKLNFPKKQSLKIKSKTKPMNLTAY